MTTIKGNTTIKERSEKKSERTFLKRAIESTIGMVIGGAIMIGSILPQNPHYKAGMILRNIETTISILEQDKERYLRKVLPYSNPEIDRSYRLINPQYEQNIIYLGEAMNVAEREKTKLLDSGEIRKYNSFEKGRSFGLIFGGILTSGFFLYGMRNVRPDKKNSQTIEGDQKW